MRGAHQGQKAGASVPADEVLVVKLVSVDGQRPRAVTLQIKS
jgi:hypothetical protein